MCQIFGLRERKVTFRIGGNETEIDFVLIKNIDGLYEMCRQSLGSVNMHQW